MPATVQAVIAARIDRLEPGAKQTLSAAAVIGSQFGPDLLISLGIDPVLEALVEAELIDQVRFTPRAEYAFRHPLIRAVAYESQLKSDRAKLHRRLAAAIEAGDPGSVEQNAAVIAENLEAAGDVQPAYGWHMRAGAWSTHRDMAAARLSWERAREIADALAPDDPERTVMRIAPRTRLCGTAYRVHAKDSLTRFEELRELSTLAGDKASLAMGMAGQVMDHWVHARVQEASALASELMALVEAIADPDMTVGLSCMPTLVKIETGEYTDVLRWSQTVIELADGDPSKGNFIIGSPLAFAHATRAVARGGLGHPLAEVLPALPVAAAMARETDPTTHAIVIAFTYGLGIGVKVLLADDAALELIDEALQIAERSADDFALGHARYALGLALMHRDSPADRERGLTVLTQLRDMCLTSTGPYPSYRSSRPTSPGSRPGVETSMVPSRHCGQPWTTCSMQDSSPGPSRPPPCSWRRCWPAAARLICRKPKPRSSGWPPPRTTRWWTARSFCCGSARCWPAPVATRPPTAISASDTAPWPQSLAG